MLMGMSNCGLQARAQPQLYVWHCASLEHHGPFIHLLAGGTIQLIGQTPMANGLSRG